MTAALLPRPRLDADGLGWPPFARRYSGGHCCFPFLRLLGCFGSSGSPPHKGDAVPAHGGLPHSDTHGSMAVRASPWSFAACRVLHRLREPRHPPYALARFSLSLVSRCIPTPFARVSRLSLCLLSLSHPVKEPRGHQVSAFVENVGLEPTTPGLQSRCSSQLSQSPALRLSSPGQTRTADPHIISVVL